MPPIIFLETERLYLRRFTLDDAPLLRDLDSDPEVMRYISKGKPTPLKIITGKVLPRWLQYYETSDHLGFWAAHEKASDAFIGWFHFRPDRIEPDAMDLGYRLRRRFWGRGYATEGSRVLVEKAFAEWDIDRVVAHALIGNVASHRVMEKCGLCFQGRFTIPETMLPGWTEAERQAVRYGMNRAEFLGVRKRSG